MWQNDARTKIWSDIEQPWDLVIVGGGITGAGILREATRLNLRALLVDQRDFAWGTSSRSSKLVHGGLRYLKEGQLRLTRVSVHERQQLLAEGPGLIDPLGFLLATYEGESAGRLVYGAGLSIYDLLALQWSHKYYSAQDFSMLAGYLTHEGLKGGFRYGDAQTDDARLVLRVIQEAVADGGTAVNYVRADELLREENRTVGVRLRDLETGQTANVPAKVVINATGAWADHLRQQVGAEAKIRPLRGSHLIFPQWRLPVPQAVSFMHPIDQRPVFVLPWEGVTLIGTTDVDHGQLLDSEPRISADEVSYLMAAVQARYPALGITLDDVLSTFAGVRPVIGSGKADPSEESRDHVVWREDGLLTVTGGKLTTFRVIAQDAIREVRHRLPEVSNPSTDMPVLNAVDFPLPQSVELDAATWRRLLGRYGADAPALLQAAQPGELEAIPHTPVLWAELRWGARAEGVVHLEDLLLRRVRLGLLVAAGGAALMPRIRSICQPELGWDDVRWAHEEAAYLELWRCCYSLPDPQTIPNWRARLKEAQAVRETAVQHAEQVNHRVQRMAAAGLVGVIAALVALLLYRRRRKV